jgi:hypothetical protein
MDGVIRMKGVPVCFGKVKARVCVAMYLEEAQCIQVNFINRLKQYEK